MVQFRKRFSLGVSVSRRVSCSNRGREQRRPGMSCMGLEGVDTRLVQPCSFGKKDLRDKYKEAMAQPTSSPIDWVARLRPHIES